MEENKARKGDREWGMYLWLVCNSKQEVCLWVVCNFKKGAFPKISFEPIPEGCEVKPGVC